MQRQQGFCCNLHALDAEERASHKKLTERLLGLRAATVEIADGYEFHFQPATTSVTELAAWVSAESRCCPFFDFHIDVEREGTLLRLRLTGSEGVKPFIRAEFHIDSR